MARPPKGKSLTLRAIRLDDDVWAECQKLREAYGTINEILVAALAALRTQESTPGAGVITTQVPQVRAEVTDVHIEGDDLYLTMRETKRSFKGELLKPSAKNRGK